MAVFYGIYLGKMIRQRKKGIQTDQIARGTKEKRVLLVEAVMKAATYSVLAVELLSLFLSWSRAPAPVRMVGAVLALCGDAVFALSVWTMRDSWRAGIPEGEQTEFVTQGIYSISRNPAFLGFDLVYLGFLMMFANWLLAAFTLWAMVMLHLQILQEERYLPTVFGAPYLDYRRRVRRYLGRK